MKEPETPQGPGFLRKILSFPVAVSALFVVLAVLTMRPRFDDPDMWWHLKTGQIIWTTHSIPTTDIFSFTTNHHAYIPHEWLAQITIFAAYKFGGYSGMMLWLCVFASAILVAGYALCSLYSGNAKVAFLGAGAIWLFGTVGFSIRPQTLGYFLLIVELLILHLGRARNPRWFFALPPLFAVWVNCHGSFFLGLLLAAALLFSAFFHFQLPGLVGPAWDWRSRLMLAGSFLLSIPALFINPLGVQQALYPLDALFHQTIGLSQVSEWQPLSFTEARGIALLAVLACIALMVIFRHSELRLHELFWLIFATWLAVSHRRMLFPFGIIVAPILSRILAGSWENYEPSKDRPLPNLVLITGSLLVAFFAFPRPQNLARQVELDSPVKAVQFIHDHHLAGPMVNQWVYGGYLIWAAPDHPVFIDGRADVFEWTGVLTEFGNWAMLKTPAADLLDKYHINFCLLARNAPIANVLPLLPNWKAVYSDNNSVIFARTPTTRN